MAREWQATCKDCGKKYGYSDDSYRRDNRLGLSRPERCPACRKLHSREIASLGLSHFDMIPVLPIPAGGLLPGQLGGLKRPKRIHEWREHEQTFDFDKFGIKDDHIRAYFDKMQKHQVTVIVAPTGAGKSTFLPYRLMVPPPGLPVDLWTRHGQLLITQPRTQATRNIPAFVAGDLHGSSLGPGFDVGFQHRGHAATDQRNKLVYMTDGTLINKIVRNELGRLSVIMIDEAHERSLNIDLILGLLKMQLPRYPHLKLIIASATIDTERFITYFGGDSDIFYEFPGKRQHPVAERYSQDAPIDVKSFPARMPEAVAAKAFDILLAMATDSDPDLITLQVNDQPLVAKGDILAFLHGEKPIEKAVKRLNELIDAEPALAGQVDVLPLYTKLPQGQQDLALKPKEDPKRRRVVITTNVAETSLTVEGIVHVIETGLINESNWDPTTQTTYLKARIHSRSGCRQRWGRAGRVQPGIAHCLYTEEQFKGPDFPEYTDPEIVRAPLDQIVLTAKAAGVDDVATFPWIQSPEPAELRRAPHYLRQIGALDAEGDLTEHGMELRAFPDELDLANLMILGDRFGCAVEMATIAAMLKVGGYTQFLEWDKSWDAPTKRAVHRIHEALMASCLDDLEFYLKLWRAWEGPGHGRSLAAREQWAKSHFVRHETMKQLLSDRETLLGSLSAYKKDLQARPIDFDLLTRLRIVLLVGLSHQIYQLAGGTAAAPEAGAALYRPYIADPSAHPELVALHQDAQVEISPESVCFGRAPDYFVCGQRRRMSRRISPQTDPLTIITATFITLIDPAWLPLIGCAPIAVARAIAATTRRPGGALIPSTSPGRLMIDQNYPVGATFDCTLDDDDGQVTIGNATHTRPTPARSSSYEDVESPGEFDQLEKEKELNQNAYERPEVKRAVVLSDEESLPVWLDMAAEESDEPPPLPLPLLPSADERFPGRLSPTPAKRLPAGASFPGIITGYDLTDRHRPVVVVEPKLATPPFQEFTQRFQPGQEIEVELVAVERYVNDWLAYLVTREPQSGMEIVLDPYDYSLSGRNYPIEYLGQLPPGAPLKVTVEEIGRSGLVRASCLPASLAANRQLLGTAKSRMVAALIVEATDDKLFLSLEPQPEQAAGRMPCVADARAADLPHLPEEMAVGRPCQVEVKPWRFKKPLRYTVKDPSAELLAALAKFPWTDNLRWDEPTHTLEATAPLTYERRCQLLALADDKEGGYRLAVNKLFRKANSLEVKVIHLAGLEALRDHQINNTRPSGVVVSVKENGLNLRTAEGLVTWVRKEDAIADQSLDLTAHFRAGQVVPEVVIREADPKHNKLKLALHDALSNFQVDQLLTGPVTGFLPQGQAAFVELMPGLDGLLPREEIGPDGVADASQDLQAGQAVRVRITDIDPVRYKVKLTARALFGATGWVPDCHLPLVTDRLEPIRRDTGTRVELTKDGYFRIGATTQAALDEARRRVQALIDYKIVAFTLDRRQQSRLLNRLPAGEVRWHGIADNTGAHIAVDGGTGRAHLAAPDEAALRQTLAELAAVVTFSQAEITIPPGKIGRVKGVRGAKINDIVARTATEIDIDNDSSGRVLIVGPTRREVAAAIAAILALADRVEEREWRDYTMPSHSVVQPPAGPPPPQPRPITPPPVSRPPSPEELVLLTVDQLALLMRKQGGFFDSLIGSKSPLEKIQDATGATVTADPSAGMARVVAESADKVKAAVDAIREVIS